MSSKLTVEIDPAFCQCIGYCQGICPEVFEIDEDAGLAKVKMPEVTDAALFDLVNEAEQACPTRAIRVTAS